MATIHSLSGMRAYSVVVQSGIKPCDRQVLSPGISTQRFYGAGGVTEGVRTSGLHTSPIPSPAELSSVLQL